MATRTRNRSAAKAADKPATAKTAARSEPDELTRERSDDAPGLSISREDFDDNPTVLQMAGIVDPDLGGRDQLVENQRLQNALARRQADGELTQADIDDMEDAAAADAEADADAGDPATTSEAADRVVPTISPDGPTAGPADSIPNQEPVRGRGPVRLRLTGTKSGGRKGRPPYGLTVIVPDGDDADYDGIHTEGETVHFVRGRSTRVSGRAAAWLEGHPELIVERV